MSPGRPYLLDLCCRRIGVRPRSSPSLALGAKDWSVPIIEVEDKIRAICRRYQVRELACDVFRWARTFQVFDGEGLPVMEFPQTPARMTPASTRFSEAVVSRTLTHDGDPQLARHVGNAVIREDSRGARLAKEHRHSRRRIDACVAAVTAVHRAAELAGASEPSIYL